MDWRDLAYSERYGWYKNEISQNCSNGMQEVGSTHSTEEASNDRGQKCFNFSVYLRNFRKNTDLGW